MTEAGARPVREGDRIETLDVLRGVAIFGIFMVNIGLFSMPLMDFVQGMHGDDVSQGDKIGAAIVKIFFEYKFVTLFSFLFGAGMVLQLTRMRDKGVPYTGVYLRRTLLLMLIGAVHACLIWYGDILFIYSWVALLAFFIWKSPPKVMLTIAGVFLALGIAMTAGFMALQVAMASNANTALVEDEGADAPASTDDEEAEIVEDGAEEGAADDGAADAEAPEEGSIGAFLEELGAAWENQQTGPEKLSRLETRVYGEGPVEHVLIMRISTWLSMLIFAVVLSGFGIRIVSMFLIGGAMMKLEFHSPRHLKKQKILAALGLTLGIGGETLAWFLASKAGPTPTALTVGSESLRFITSILLCMGYISTICVLVNTGALRWLQHAFASVGRMALTNYLAQSLIATGVFYWWGLGKFGTFSRPEQLYFVIAIYVGQIIFSVIWMKIFRIGPAEWLWRSMTYLKPQPLLR